MVQSFNHKTDGLNSPMHLQRKGKMVDENMKKYNEDDVNYQHNVQIEDNISLLPISLIRALL